MNKKLTRRKFFTVAAGVATAVALPIPLTNRGPYKWAKLGHTEFIDLAVINAIPDSVERVALLKPYLHAEELHARVKAAFALNFKSKREVLEEEALALLGATK